MSDLSHKLILNHESFMAVNEGVESKKSNNFPYKIWPSHSSGAKSKIFFYFIRLPKITSIKRRPGFKRVSQDGRNTILLAARTKPVSGPPGWLRRSSVRLRLRSWSHGSWVRAPRRALCWQLRAWSLLRILCLPLSLSPTLLSVHRSLLNNPW